MLSICASEDEYFEESTSKEGLQSMEGMCICLLVKKRNWNGLSTWSMTPIASCCMWVVQLMFVADGAPQKVHAWAGIKVTQVCTNTLWRVAQNTWTKGMWGTSLGPSLTSLTHLKQDLRMLVMLVEWVAGVENAKDWRIRRTNGFAGLGHSILHMD